MLTKYTKHVEDINKETLLLKTLHDSISIVFGSNDIGYAPKGNESVQLKYLKLPDSLPSNADYLKEKVQLQDPSISILDFTIITPYYEEDSLLKIATLAPGYYNAGRRMVSDSDYIYVMRSYPGLISTSFNYGYCSIKPDEIFDQEQCEYSLGSWDNSKPHCSVEPDLHVDQVDCESIHGVWRSGTCSIDPEININSSMCDHVQGEWVPYVLHDGKVLNGLCSIDPEINLNQEQCEDATATWIEGTCDVDPEINDTKEKCINARGHWHSGKIGCCTVVMSYLFPDEHYITVEEESAMIQYASQFWVPGSGLVFKDPKPTLLTPDFDIITVPKADVISIKNKINDYINKVYCMQLGATFLVADVVAYAQGLPGVLRIYVNKPVEDKTLTYDRYFRLSDSNINFFDNAVLRSYGGLDSNTGYKPL